METRHFIKTLCKQKVKSFFLSNFIALKVRWVPHLITSCLYCKTERCADYLLTYLLVLTTFVHITSNFPKELDLIKPLLKDM